MINFNLFVSFLDLIQLINVKQSLSNKVLQVIKVSNKCSSPIIDCLGLGFTVNCPFPILAWEN
jgi:hypothetical protein